MPSYVVAFSSRGSPNTLENAMAKVSDKERLVVLIGGFPHGHFTETTIKLANEVVRIDPEMLEAWAVTARIIYEYERCIYLPKKRLER
jgi:rRNA pseudouridine-1189 N-methylase Emg1 (Nep1/Mra1 family)